MLFPYPNPLFFVGFGSERIMLGCGYEYGFFSDVGIGMDMERKQIGYGFK